MNRFATAGITLVLAFTTLPTWADDHSVISTEDIQWGLLNPLRGDASPRAADLWGDRTKDVATGMLVRFKRGFSSPPHIHNVSYRGVVIEGLMHNDDPHAAKMWLSSGSFWTQPAGESHITAADGENNLIYLEIDSGPYLVHPAEKAFDNGERPINVDKRNLVWLDAGDVTWLEQGQVKLAYLWGQPDGDNGSFVQLPAGFSGAIDSDGGLKSVVVRGKARHQWNDEPHKTLLLPSSFFASKGKGKHRISTDIETVLYINSNGRYRID
tara:strand:+ start:85 stop:888 length:804 start_codon:yes stop_codon:yes gene_type:complete